MSNRNNNRVLWRVESGDAVVADLGGGHQDDLAPVGGVGEDLLVAGHGGVEDQFTGDFPATGEGSALKTGAVFQGD